MSGYDPFEDRLRQVLLAEAQTVTPAGDGLSQIRAKVARRRDVLRWLRPGLALATAAVVAGAAVFAVSLGDSASRTLKQDHRPASQLPGPASNPPTGPASPSPSGGPMSVGGTSYPIWPYTSLAQAQAAQRSGGGAAWHRDAAQTALRFMGYLQAPEVDRVMANEKETTTVGAGRKVTLGRKMADGTVAAVTVVHLVRLGSGTTAPYAVTVAGAYRLAITAPEIAAPVRSPLAVRGTITGVDESIRVEVRTPSAGTPISAPTAAMGGTGKPWQTSVSFTAPSSGTGTLVARTDSAAGDGAAQIAARPVLLIAGSTTSPAYPAGFVGVSTDGRVAVFNSASGQVLRYLTTVQPGGGVSDLTLSPDGTRAYFTRATGTCSAHIASVALTGGPETVAIPAPAGSLVSNPVLIGEGGTVAYLRTVCAGAGQAVVLSSLGGGGGSQTWYATPSNGVELLGFRPGSPQVLLRESAPGSGSQLRLLDTTRPEGSLEAAAPVVRQPPAGCSYSAAS